MATPSRFQDSALVETVGVTRANLPTALAVLQGGWKSSSILWMHANRVPTLSGLVLRGWSTEAAESVVHFSRNGNFHELLLRIEEPGQRWTRRRGGYNVAVAQIDSIVESLAAEGLLAILLEPASPYTDHFSLTCVCEVDSGKIDLEIVGPGFDASDLLRADIAPHERFEITFNNLLATAGSRHKFQANRKYLIDHDKYRASVHRRLVKIGARLRNPSFPEEWMEPSAANSISEGLAQDARRYLQESGQTTLLLRSDRYEPIPVPLLDMFLSELFRVSGAVAESAVSWRTFSLAGSFLSDDRLTIWDFFPLGNHDTNTLSHLML
jgi:hypothetical protein